MDTSYLIHESVLGNNSNEDGTKDPDRSKKYKIILWGLLVHFLLLFAVFDVYFSSPLDQGMVPVKSTPNPPARRLVLIVADGLRAESVLEKKHEIRIPFLSKVKQSGSWGVVHTRVPTESRPGHVAMLAGIYEDPSAIFKGWKTNPVNFDSVINQSANSWAWGSPGVVDLFNKDRLPTIHSYIYDLTMEDFGKRNIGILDIWVYRKVEKFLKDSVQACSAVDCERYFSQGNVFFLHLLGVDTVGHGYKPHSKEYVDNIRLVDEIVKNTTELFETTFKDKSTAFIFTSDHGMTDWGSHGAGSLHETEVPIIAWGAGIKIGRYRRDIDQVDIAPLLSTLIGINIPVNSLGILPAIYLNLSKHDRGKVLLENTQQLLRTFNVKRSRIENNAIVYVPFKGVTTLSIHKRLYHLNELESEGEIRYHELLRDCTYFMKYLIEGIHYYHSYYRYPVLISISVGFLGWILFLSVSVFLYDKQKKQTTTSNKYNKAVVLTAISTVLLLSYKQKFPLTYYFYFSFPVAVISIVVQDLRNNSVLPILQFFYFKNNFGNIIFYIAGIEMLMYGFFSRVSLTVLMVLIGFWLLLSKNLDKTTTKNEKYVWMGCCFVLAVFPSLPVMKTSFNVPVYLAGFLGWIYIFKAVYINKISLYCQPENTVPHYRPFYVQVLCLLLSAFYILLLEYQYVPSDSNVKYISWFLLIVPILMIPLTSTYIATRLIATFFGFAPFYLLVSPNYEVLFSVFYVALLCCWLSIESKSFQFRNHSNIVYYAKFDSYKSETGINADVFRKTFLFMVFIFLGFFGTGNIASLNSFDPMWVRAFLTVFSPYKMMGLILLKFAVPFIFTCCTFRAINSVGRENILNIFCIILIFSDIMVLQLLYLITNEGSWLDIGTSLSRFIVMEGFIIILLLLYGIAHLLTTVSYYNHCNLCENTSSIFI